MKHARAAATRSLAPWDTPRRLRNVDVGRIHNYRGVLSVRRETMAIVTPPVYPRGLLSARDAGFPVRSSRAG